MVIREVLTKGYPGIPEDWTNNHFSGIVCSAISHELGTSVAVIDSNVQLFKKFRYSLNAELRNESLGLCGEAVKDLARLFENISMLDNIQKSRIFPRKSKLHLREFVKQLNRDFRMLSHDYRRIEKRWNLEHEDVYCDEHILYKILFELVSNALKFSGDKIQLTLASAGHWLMISVEDHGIGIPGGQFNLVFQPFYRASNVGNLPGAGLGLAIAYALVRAVEGSLCVSSEVNVGSVFKLMIPYQTEVSC